MQNNGMSKQTAFRLPDDVVAALEVEHARQIKAANVKVSLSFVIISLLRKALGLRVAPPAPRGRPVKDQS